MITQSVLALTAADPGNDIFVAAAMSAITLIYLCNTSGSAVTVTLHVKDATGTATADGNMIYDAIDIPANDTFVIDMERLILDTDNVIVAFASSAAAVTATISSMEC